MLIVDVARVIVVLVVIVSMAVAMMMTVIVVVMHRSQRRLGPRRLQRAHEAAALGPDQPGAEQRDQAIAGNLDRLLRPAHGLRGGIEQPGTDADQHDGDESLQQCRDERQHDATPGGLLVGDEVGGDHRLAVARAGGVENPVGKRDAEQRPHRRAVGLGGADGGGHFAVEFGLLCQQPSEDATDLRLCRGLRPAEWILRQHVMNEAIDSHQAGQRDGEDREVSR
ncbi:hypothetical protein ES707_18060 [subsurface metagenome]